MQHECVDVSIGEWRESFRQALEAVESVEYSELFTMLAAAAGGGACAAAGGGNP